MSSIRNAIERAYQSKVAMAEQKDAICFLERLGEARAEIFIRDIQASLMTAGEEKSNKTVPITFLLSSHREVRAFSASEIGNIGTAVSVALKSFLNSDKELIINGLSGVITDALKRFLGSDEASSDTIEMYFIATDGLSPVRIDIKAWYYSVTAESIRRSMERITTVVATKSSIDVTRIDLATFLFLFEHQFAPDAMSTDELAQAVNDAADVYNTYVERACKKGLISQQRAATPERIKDELIAALGKVRQVEDHVTKINNKLDL